MEGLSTEEQLRIANSGEQFAEVGPNSWVGTEIRKETKLGVVTCDMNGASRTLTVTFEDGTTEEIVMNNIGPDLNQEELKKFEWHDKTRDKWYNFGL